MARNSVRGEQKQSLEGREPNSPGAMELVKELWQAAVMLRGSIEPAEYKRFVLPIIFLRFLSLRHEHRRPGAFAVPRKARWSELLAHADDVDIKVRLDHALEALEAAYPDKLRGLLPRIYAASNMERQNVTRLHQPVLHATSSRRTTAERTCSAGSTSTSSASSPPPRASAAASTSRPPASCGLLVAMLEPTEGVVYDPCCGSGGMFVQSDLFTRHSRELSFFGQESKDFTYRLCRMNLFIHGLDGNISLGNTYFDDQHPTLKADYILANPPFNDGSKGREGWGADKLSETDPRLSVDAEADAARAAQREHDVDDALPASPQGRRLGGLRHGGRRAVQQPAGRLEVRTALRRGRPRGLRGAALLQLFANTQIPCTLWFLSKARAGGRGSRKRLGELLFIDGRTLGAMIPGSRRQKQLSDQDVERIASVYREFRRTSRPSEVPGFARVASLQEVRDQGYALTPGTVRGLRGHR